MPNVSRISKATSSIIKNGKYIYHRTCGGKTLFCTLLSHVRGLEVVVQAGVRLLSGSIPVEHPSAGSCGPLVHPGESPLLKRELLKRGPRGWDVPSNLSCKGSAERLRAGEAWRSCRIMFGSRRGGARIRVDTGWRQFGPGDGVRPETQRWCRSVVYPVEAR